jgi:hypothetical protein
MNVIAGAKPTPAQGETNMINETTETAANETANKKAAAGARKPRVAKSAAKATKNATPTKKATPKPKAAGPAKAVREKGAPREGSKTSQVIAMLKRKGGTTLEEIMTKMGWLQHTTRALLSAGGSLTKKHGLVVISEKVGDERRYSIKG